MAKVERHASLPEHLRRRPQLRCDELYGPGGFDPDHPSGNVLDRFVHEDEEPEPGKPVRVQHFDRDGNTLEDRLLSDEELEFFEHALFPDRLAYGARIPTDEEVMFLRSTSDERVFNEYPEVKRRLIELLYADATGPMADQEPPVDKPIRARRTKKASR